MVHRNAVPVLDLLALLAYPVLEAGRFLLFNRVGFSGEAAYSFAPLLAPTYLWPEWRPAGVEAAVVPGGVARRGEESG